MQVIPTEKRVPLDLLFVEDNPSDSKMLMAFLNEAQHPLTIKVVTDGEEAVKYLTRKGEYNQATTPDVVLLDINLPKKNGFEVLAEIRQDSRFAEIPVFIISSTKNPEDIRRGQALNVAGFYPKPMELSGYQQLADTLTNQEFPKFFRGKYSPVCEQRVPPPRQQNDELYRQLVEAVKDYAIFMLDTKGHVLTWNEGAQRVKGYEASEIIGKHFSIFYPEEALQIGHPTHELEVAARTGRFEEEGWRIRKDGSQFWANVTITAIRNKSGDLLGFGKVTRDFSERRENEKNLRESERRLKLLVEGVKDYAIFMLSPQGNIASWNVGAERIKGYKASEIIGRHFSLFYTKEALDVKHPDHELKIAREKGVYEEEGLRVRKDGSTFWASVLITAIYNEDGSLQGFSKVTRDITEQKRSEEESHKFAERLEEKIEERTHELQESRKELIAQRDQLIRSNTDLQQFAYVASHDLQEPLRGIVTCHQMLERRFGKQITPEMHEYMSLAIDNSMRMKGLIEDLLQYGRIGQALQYHLAVDFSTVVEKATHSIDALILKSNTKIVIGAMPTLAADASQMTQVFTNLISNAVKYRSEKDPIIEINANRKGNNWEFSIRDNGIGIDAQYFERIFVIFQRLHSDRDKYPGTGIGLAICKRIVEAHRGRIWVESKRGQGTTFYFSLPA